MMMHPLDPGNVLDCDDKALSLTIEKDAICFLRRLKPTAAHDDKGRKRRLWLQMIGLAVVVAALIVLAAKYVW